MRQTKIEALEKLNAVLNSKVAKQRNEIARLTQALERATEEKRALLRENRELREVPR